MAGDAKGFSAHWHLLDLNRSYGQHWTDATDSMDQALQASAFGVQLYQPVDVYQRNERAGKYGLLFIAMTFVAFFLFEVLKRLRVHPVQYLLVGAALATFYVVLLALSEQMGFGAAYAVAAASVAFIVGGYAMAVLSTRRAGLLLGGVLLLIYAMLYGLIAAEEYALPAIARPGRVRGRPVPRRAMRTCSSSGMNCGQSPFWPGGRIRVTGRHRRSAAR